MSRRGAVARWDTAAGNATGEPLGTVLHVPRSLINLFSHARTATVTITRSSLVSELIKEILIGRMKYLVGVR